MTAPGSASASTPPTSCRWPVATAVNAAVFLRVYGRQLDRPYEVAWRSALHAAARDRPFFRATAAGLGLLCLAFLVAAAAGIPLGAVAAAGGAALLALGAAMRRLRRRFVRERVSLSLFVYVAGLFVLVAAVEHAGLTEARVAREIGRAHV